VRLTFHSPCAAIRLASTTTFTSALRKKWFTSSPQRPWAVAYKATYKARMSQRISHVRAVTTIFSDLRDKCQAISHKRGEKRVSSYMHLASHQTRGAARLACVGCCLQLHFSRYLDFRRRAVGSLYSSFSTVAQVLEVAPFFFSPNQP
jgi:hypothetical protein